MTTSLNIFQNCAPEYVAVVLASSTGSRLFPVTSSSLPKHMMPICGIPVVTRLLSTIEASGFQECVVVLAPDDKSTIPHFKDMFVKDDDDENDANASNSATKDNNNRLAGSYQMTTSKPYIVLESETTNMKITILPLHDDCEGSIDALRKVEEAGVVPDTSHMVVMPGDLVVFDTSVLCNLCDTHRQGYHQGGISTACTVLLADVGEQDEHGVPLKESAKVGTISVVCVFRLFVIQTYALGVGNVCLAHRVLFIYTHCSKRKEGLLVTRKILNISPCRIHQRHPPRWLLVWFGNN